MIFMGTHCGYVPPWDIQNLRVVACSVNLGEAYVIGIDAGLCSSHGSRLVDIKTRKETMSKEMKRQLNAKAAIAVTLTLARAPNTPAMAFVWPALSPEAGRGVGKGCFHGVPKEGCRIDSTRCSSIVRRPQRNARNSRAHTVYGEKFGLFGWDIGAGNSISGSDRPTPTAARTNGADVGEVLAPGGVSTKMDKAKERQQQQPFFTLRTFLQNIVPSDEESPTSSNHTASHSDVVAGGVIGDRSEGTDDVAADAAMGAEQTVPTAVAHTNAGLGGGVIGDLEGLPGLRTGVERNLGHGSNDGDVEDDEGGEQERRGKRDIYKIRSLLLQGQIAGLRERLKERELDVRELRVLTGGRGQSKLRELGALLKEAREECDALRAREQALAEELATSQKEGDMLRGDLLANQKALSDLNVYADSLRSRYTAEMVKLEASLAEMERELTRAEAAHMRERRALLDKEASAVADGARYRNRTILLQGEVLKTRARESKLRDENARLLATYEATAAAAAAATTTDETPAIADKTQEEEALRRENEELRARLETALPRAVAEQRGRGKSDVAATEFPANPATLENSSDAAEEVPSPTLISRETETVTVEIVEGAGGIDDNSGARRGEAPVFRGWRETSTATCAAAGGVGQGPRTAPTPIPVEAVLSPPVEDAGFKTTAIARAAGFADEALASRAFEEAGVARVVTGLNEENARLRKRLRAVEIAADFGEARANDEATRGDELEAELARVRVTVRGRVQALKAALEEAEGDAEQAVAEKQEHMRQWAEDVDALRAQLVAERRAWESDRSELEEIVAELEDEERYRRRNESAVDGQVQSQQQKRRRSPQGNNAGTRKSNASGSRVSGGGKKSLKSDRRGRAKSGGWWPGQETEVPVSASYPSDGECEENEEEEEYPEDKGMYPLGDADKASSEEQWDKAMRLLQYLY